MKALEGIRVFDMTRVLAGPFCTQILGDLGADVIKIEKPHEGDVTRTWGPPYEKDTSGKNTQESAYYLSCNRNKRSVTLDFTTPEGLELAKELIKNSDVFIENFKTGILAKHGLGYEDVKKIKSDIIYCSITGFGQTGPYANRPGFDFQVQGLSGLMSLVGEPEGDPLRAGISISDLVTGIYSAVAIQAALYQRTQTGEGQYIDMALLDSTMALMSFTAQSYLMGGCLPSRVGNAHPNIVPYGAFRAADGHVILTIGTDKQFNNFCRFVGREDLIANPRYITNEKRVIHRNEVIEEISQIIKQYPRQYWIDHLGKIDVPVGPVNTLAEAFENPQVKARHIVQSHDTLSLIASPLHLQGSPPSYRLRPPRLGEHTNEVLSEVLSADRLKKLKDKGVV